MFKSITIFAVTVGFTIGFTGENRTPAQATIEVPMRVRVLRTSDISGDGKAEILIGSSDSEAVHVLNGTDLKASVSRSARGDLYFGHAAEFIGDVNGDGVNDMAIGGLYMYDRRDQRTGLVGLYSGKAKDGPALATVAGDHAGDEFGYSIAALSDINGDKVPDFAVGATGRQVTLFDPAAKEKSYVCIFSGATREPIRTIEKKGAHVFATGDLDGDKLGDFCIVDARLLTAFSARTFQPLYSISPEQLQREQGKEVRCGDYDGDGIEDHFEFFDEKKEPETEKLQKAITESNAGGVDWSGVSWKSSVRDGKTGQIEMMSSGRFEAFSFTQLEFARTGDFDGDSIDDYLLGFPEDCSRAYHSGAAAVISGKTGQAIFVVRGEAPYDGMGESICSADFNGDGRQDLVVGMALEVRVYSGTNQSLLHTVKVPYETNRVNTTWAYTLANGGDRDGRPGDEIIIGDLNRQTLSIHGINDR